ncbi:MAG: hypothetical protein V1897_15940 [Pseudomonadota bacterium]
MAENRERISEFLNSRLDFGAITSDSNRGKTTSLRIVKAFESLPGEILDLFLTGTRNLRIRLIPDPILPFGMKTRSENCSGQLIYTLTVCNEAQDWDEDRFLGSFLRELGHVVAMLPPECEWPTNRGERARFRELVECKADAMVWKWGLRHYDIIYLSATYPSHWVDKIVNDISLMLICGENSG